MKIRNMYLLKFICLAAILTAAFASSANAQNGNRISGYVFGAERRPLADLYVELQDDFYRTISRTRTNSSGFYSFSGISSGAFVVRVITAGTDFEEQEKRVEIQNFTSTTSTGGTRISGLASEQADFSLKLKRGVLPGTTAALFFQDVPEAAKKLYDNALEDLADKRKDAGLVKLKSSLEIFPKYFAALERLGTEYVELRSVAGYQAAEVLFTVAVDVNPRAFRSWYGLAYAQYSLKKYQPGLLNAKKAVEANTEFADAYSLYGVLLKQAKKYADAEKQLLKAVELSKDSIPHVHWELALIYGNHLDRYADAARELKMFLKMSPNSKDSENIKKLIAEFESKADPK